MHDTTSLSFTVASFYQFTPLNALPSLRDRLAEFGAKAGLCGTILLAPEGINATVAGNSQSIDQLRSLLEAENCFTALNWKQTNTSILPFKRWKVRIKSEIVTFGVSGLNPAQVTGVFVEPSDWNACLDDPETIVIDTRNHYEVTLGTFSNARDPETDSFSQFADYVTRELAGQEQRKIAMFCTGGIRCEKASSYLLSRGFNQVVQLRGGILNYLQQIPVEHSRWRGECVVFDERVAVNHTQSGWQHRWCAKCGDPILRTQGDQCGACCVDAGQDQPAKTPISTLSV